VEISDDGRIESQLFSIEIICDTLQIFLVFLLVHQAAQLLHLAKLELEQPG
jgi:hypothetical protein